MRKAKSDPSPRRTLTSHVSASPVAHPATHRRRRVLLTGASGFVGREVKRQLLAEGWEVVAVARRLRPEETRPGVIQVAADLAGDGWQRWCEGCHAAINLVGIIREVRRSGATFERMHHVATAKVIAACRSNDIHRLLQMSALGTRANAAAEYHRSKWRGEEAVRSSGLDWTIFRPSLIHGPASGFESQLAPRLRSLPFFPVFGDGTCKLQPIAVSEVARAFVAALDRPAAIGQCYDLGGPEAFTWDELLGRMMTALGIRRPLLHIPLPLARALVSLLQHLPGAPVTRDQLTMLLEGSTCDTAATALAFDIPQIRYQGPTWMKPVTAQPNAAITRPPR